MRTVLAIILLLVVNPACIEFSDQKPEGYNLYQRENKLFKPWKFYKAVGLNTVIDVPEGYCYKATAYNSAGESEATDRVCR